MDLSIQLAEIFLGNPGGVYSIHQISKKLEIPYGTAYNRIHDLGKRGIVNIMPQGKAKLCSLNPANPMTPTLLGLGAAQATTKYLLAKAPYAGLIFKLCELLESSYQDSLHSAILLNPDVEYNKKTQSIFDITEEKNNFEAIKILKSLKI